MAKVLRFTKENGFTTTESRSKLMAKIMSSNTSPEICFRKQLWSRGIRYRINYKKLPGKPDIVIPCKKIAIFVDGEFWHGYNWKEKKKKIKTNRSYWIPKIERNMKRDLDNNIALKKLGYKIFRFWGHEVKKQHLKCINKILRFI